jgi:hypothetical protein
LTPEFVVPICKCLSEETQARRFAFWIVRVASLKTGGGMMNMAKTGEAKFE